MQQIDNSTEIPTPYSPFLFNCFYKIAFIDSFILTHPNLYFLFQLESIILYAHGFVLNYRIYVSISTYKL